MFRLRPRRAAQVAAEVDDEISLHLQLRAEQLERMGLPPDRAREEAQRLFGAVDDARRSLRHSVRRREGRLRMRDTMDALLQDVRYAARRMARQPAFAVAVVVTLALGIGANATMFGIVDRLLLRPPAYLAAPERTGRVYVFGTWNGEEQPSGNLAYQRIKDLRAHARTLEATAVHFSTESVFGVGEEARQSRLSLVSASFWSFFEARPVIGRFFGEAEDREPSGVAVAVLGHGYWRSRFGGDTAVLGQSLRIGGQDYTIIGVAPPGFHGPSLAAVDAFVPVTAGGGDMFSFVARRGGRERWYNMYNFSWAEMFARRKAEATVEAVDADLTAAYRRSLEAERAANPRGGRTPLDELKPRAVFASVLHARGPQAGQESRVTTWLAGVAVLVLLIACANVANLMLARAVQRRREIGVRIALGVSRRRLLAQLLVESTVLALVAGVVGVLAAHWGGGVLGALLLPDVEWSGASFDGRILLFTATASLLAGILTGMAPALQLSRPDVVESVKAGGREGGLHRSRMRAALLVAQGAVSVVLLIGAGLFVRSLTNVRGLDLGYEPDRLASVSIEWRGVVVDSARASQLFQAVRERAAQLPIAETAARTVAIPFWQTWSETLVSPGVDSARLAGEFLMNAVSPEYFTATGISIRAGRGITEADRNGSERVAVLSARAAQQLWPGEPPLGKCIKMGADSMPCITVVGIAEDVRASFEDGPARHVYLPIVQTSNDGNIFVRTRGEARRHTETIRRELQRLMPGAAWVDVRPLQDIVEPNMRSWRLGATMFTIFGGLALLVAAVGLYSVIAYGVAQRKHELGVRIALGAAARDVVRLIVGEGARVAVVGILLGVAVALVAGRWVAPLLYEVSPRDPLTFGVIVATLLLVALAASLIPALRASRVDPNEALRSD